MIVEFINTYAGAPLARASAKQRNKVFVNGSMLCRPDEVLRAGAEQEPNFHFYM